MMKKLMFVGGLLVALMFSATAFAQDLTGIYTGAFTGITAGETTFAPVGTGNPLAGGQQLQQMELPPHGLDTQVVVNIFAQSGSSVVGSWEGETGGNDFVCTVSGSGSLLCADTAGGAVVGKVLGPGLLEICYAEGGVGGMIAGCTVLSKN